MSQLRVLIAGGGTGGHVFPMLAVAGRLKAIHPDCQILFIGASGRIETKLVPRAGYELKTLSISGVKGKGIAGKLTALLKLPWALLRSAFIVTTFGPHVVLSGGGYAAWPACRAAAFLGRPLALLEVNSLPGMVTRMLAGKAKRAYTAFPATAGHLKCQCLLTGNPIRPELHQIGELPMREHLSLLIMGGSQGAVGLNSLVVEALPELKRSGVKLRIIHQTGGTDVSRVRQAYEDAGLNAEVTPFIEDMRSAYAEADLVISRAGATSVAELMAAGRPSILVPLPTAADDHQTVNAREIADIGGGVVLPQASSSGKDMANQIEGWYHHRSQLQAMHAKLKAAVKTDSADLIARDLITLAERDTD